MVSQDPEGRKETWGLLECEVQRWHNITLLSFVFSSVILRAFPGLDVHESHPKAEEYEPTDKGILSAVKGEYWLCAFSKSFGFIKPLLRLCIFPRKHLVI